MTTPQPTPQSRPQYRVEISIPEPCHEDWHAMTPVEKGHFCASCERVVRDFTQMEPQEILDEFIAAKGKICGAYSNEMITESTATPIPQFAFSNWTFAKKFTLALLVVFGLQLFTMSGAHASHNLDYLRDAIVQVVETNPETKKVISGAVLDALTGESLAGATIVVMADSVMVTGTVSDMEGNYSLHLDETQWEKLQKGEVKISFLGYKAHVMPGAEFAGQYHHIRDVQMETTDRCLCKEVLITAPNIGWGGVTAGVSFVRIQSIRMPELPEDTRRSVRINFNEDY